MSALTSIEVHARERNAAFAQMYAAKADTERALRINFKMMVKLATLCLLVAECEAVCQLDPDGELAAVTKGTFAALQLTDRGEAAIAEARSKRKDPR